MGFTLVVKVPLLFGDFPNFIHCEQWRVSPLVATCLSAFSPQLCGVAIAHIDGLFPPLQSPAGGNCMCVTVDLNLSFVAEVWLLGSNGSTCTRT